MTKVAYLFGVSGSWKTYIAEQLGNDVQVIKVDALRDNAAKRLFPQNRPTGDEWERCAYFLGNPNLPSEFSGILGELRPPLSDDRPLLAEGISLGHDRWRQAFRTALKSQGITITEEAERLFWIHPPPEVVWHNRQHRGRKGQRGESLDEVRQHCDRYHEWVRHHLSCLYEDPDKAIRAIRQFLLP